MSEEFDAEKKSMRDPKNLQGDSQPAAPPEGINLEFASEIVRMTASVEGWMVGRRHLRTYKPYPIPPKRKDIFFSEELRTDLLEKW